MNMSAFIKTIALAAGLTLGIAANAIIANAQDSASMTEEDIRKALFEQPVEEPVDIASMGNAEGQRGVASQLVDDDKHPSTNASIQFKSGSAEILPESLDLLRLYGKLLVEFDNTTMIIIGHTDDVGNDTYNQKLSERRAESVKQFFVSEFGVTEGRLVAVGYGEKKPLVNETTPEARAKNRRVQFMRAQ